MDENAIHYCIAVQYCHIMYVRTHTQNTYIRTYIGCMYVQYGIEMCAHQCLATERKYCTVVPS